MLVRWRSAVNSDFSLASGGSRSKTYHSRKWFSFIRRNVHDYIHLTGNLQSESSTTMDGPLLTPFVFQQQLSKVRGFVMLENQIVEMFTHKLASNPIFLKLLLRCAHWAVIRGITCRRHMCSGAGGNGEGLQ